MEKNEIVEAEKNNIADNYDLDTFQEAIAEAVDPNQKFDLDRDNTLFQQKKYIQTMFGEYFFMDLKGQKQLNYHLDRYSAISISYGINHAEKTREKLEKKEENDYYNSVNDYFPDKELVQND